MIVFFFLWNGKFSSFSGENKDSSREQKTFELKFFDEPLAKSWINYSQLKLSEDKFSWRSYDLEDNYTFTYTLGNSLNEISMAWNELFSSAII